MDEWVQIAHRENGSKTVDFLMGTTENRTRASAAAF
jgi:hypothetical protein